MRSWDASNCPSNIIEKYYLSSPHQMLREYIFVIATLDSDFSNGAIVKGKDIKIGIISPLLVNCYQLLSSFYCKIPRTGFRCVGHG